MSELEYGMDPQGRFRFYGIYSAKVVDITDPLKLNRIRVKVLQPTGNEITTWAQACLPVTSIANHPDHQEHLAADIANLLTTTSTGVVGGTGGGTVPALTVVAKSGAGTLKHPHKTTASTTEKWNDAVDAGTTEEHTPHRLLPKIGQVVWVMFIAGDLEYPVWIGVSL